MRTIVKHITRAPATWWLLAAALLAVSVTLLSPLGGADAPQGPTYLHAPLEHPRPQDPVVSSRRPAPESDPPDRTTPPTVGPGTHAPVDAVAAADVHADPPGQEPWRDTVAGFAEAFTDPTPDHDEWVGRLALWVTPDLVSQYQASDSTRRPHGTPTAVDVIANGEYSADAAVSYDSGLTIRVRVEAGQAGWRVTSAIPIRA